MKLEDGMEILTDINTNPNIVCFLRTLNYTAYDMKSNTYLTLEDIGSFLAKLAEKSESVYWLSSPDLKSIVYISPAFEKIWGRPCEVLYSNPELWGSFLHPDDAQNYHPVKEMAERVNEFGPNARYEENYRIIRPDGEVRWIIDRGFPIYNNQAECIGITGVAVDVTSEKQHEIALQRAKEAAERADQAKTEFMENMSHDLRTPITGILGLLAIMKTRLTAAEDKNDSDLLIDSANELLKIVNGILEFSETTVVLNQLNETESVFDLRELIHNNIKLILPAVKLSKLDIYENIAEDVPKLLCGKQFLLDRILMNLIGNAVKFTPKGHMKISAAVLKTTQDVCHIQISVEDTGIGIAKEKQQVVFERFTRLNPSCHGLYKGTGLGLYFVKQYVEALQGNISLDSVFGQGSKFIVTLPLKVAEFSHEEKAPPFAASKNLDARLNILVIEDNEIAARMAKHIIEDACHFVVVVSSGAEALEILGQKRFDFILLDIGLPDIDGMELAHMLRTDKNSLNNSAPIVALTAHLNPEKKYKQLASDIQGIITKPLTRDKLNEYLSKMPV